MILSLFCFIGKSTCQIKLNIVKEKEGIQSIATKLKLSSTNLIPDNKITPLITETEANLLVNKFSIPIKQNNDKITELMKLNNQINPNNSGERKDKKQNKKMKNNKVIKNRANEEVEFEHNKINSNNDFNPETKAYIYKLIFFVPLVILIFIATVLSIAGFLVLFINSAKSLNSLEETEKDYEFINDLIRINQEKYMLRKEMRRRRRARRNEEIETNNNYKKEPENEDMVVTRV